MIADPRAEAPAKPPQEFSFAKRFLLFSLLLVGGSTMLLTWFTVREVSEELTESTVEHATEVARNVFHDVEQEFLVPLAAYEVYLLAKERGGGTAKLATSAGLFALTLLMAVGVAAAIGLMWLPRIT